MDASSLLAANAVALLAPYLAKAAESIVPKAAEDLYNAVKARLSGKPAAQEALDELEKAPEDADAQAALRLQIKKVLAEDEEFSQQLGSLVERAEESSSQPSIRASGRGVAAGRDISGTVLTGDIDGPVTIGGSKDDGP